jgi:hypothetical protein
MTNNFSHLVVNGCSFTYCQGLRYPLKEGWPKLLAEKLDVPLINLATPGAGNDNIVRTTVEHLYNNPLSNPLYVIAFSHSSRREEFYKKLQNYKSISFHNKSIDTFTPYEIGYLQNFDSLAYSKTKTRLWLSLVNTFKANNIKYLTTDFIPDSLAEIENLKQSYSLLWDAVNNDDNRITDLEQLTRNIHKLPCGHEDYPAMPVLANYIYEEIRKRWH